MLISVITTTYNRPDALRTVLRGLSRQIDRNFEVVIGDDGSGDATASVIERCRSEMALTIRHVWQEQRGFRAAEIRNRAILASRGKYCVFLDGDCIPRPAFIGAHRRLAEPGWFVSGTRVLLSKSATARIIDRDLSPELWRPLAWFVARARGDVNRLNALLTLPLGRLRKASAHKWLGAKTCNLGVWRSDLDLVDGFDASFVGWGLEDSDMVVRLHAASVRRKDGRHSIAVLHLWHEPGDRSQLRDNQLRFDASLAGNPHPISGLSSLALVPSDVLGCATASGRGPI
jgi:glycosyltransferase involved in cell wall biosynthesis